jgi:hypothetical protein
MKDMQTHLEKLRNDAAECTLIRDLATDKKKRELFARLADHLTALADDVERTMKSTIGDVKPYQVKRSQLDPYQAHKLRWINFFGRDAVYLGTVEYRLITRRARLWPLASGTMTYEAIERGGISAYSYRLG